MIATDDKDLFKLIKIASRTLHHHGHGKASQERILLIIERFGMISQKDLLEIVNVRSASLSEILKKIEANGYIKKKQSVSDKRTMVIEITETGKKEAVELRSQNLENSQKLFNGLNKEEQAELAKLLGKLINSWELD